MNRVSQKTCPTFFLIVIEFLNNANQTFGIVKVYILNLAIASVFNDEYELISRNICGINSVNWYLLIL